MAREAGRALAQAPSQARGLADARAAALDAARGYGLDATAVVLDLQTGSFRRGEVVRARASYPVELADLPLLPRARATVSASHEERLELYRSRARALP